MNTITCLFMLACVAVAYAAVLPEGDVRQNDPALMTQVKPDDDNSESLTPEESHWRGGYGGWGGYGGRGYGYGGGRGYGYGHGYGGHGGHGFGGYGGRGFGYGGGWGGGYGGGFGGYGGGFGWGR